MMEGPMLKYDKVDSKLGVSGHTRIRSLVPLVMNHMSTCTILASNQLPNIYPDPNLLVSEKLVAGDRVGTQAQSKPSESLASSENASNGLINAKIAKH